MKYINNTGLELEILSRVGKQCTVKFTVSGSVRKAGIDNIRVGKVKDLYHPSRYGVGYDGDIDKTIPYWKRARDLWSNMIKRCYFHGDTRNSTYIDIVTVDPRWHCFATFLTDISTLNGFDKWLRKEGMELDKDLNSSGNKVYSVHTCEFLTKKRNRQLQPNYRIGKKFCKETKSWINA